MATNVNNCVTGKFMIFNVRFPILPYCQINRLQYIVDNFRYKGNCFSVLQSGIRYTQLGAYRETY